MTKETLTLWLRRGLVGISAAALVATVAYATPIGLGNWNAAYEADPADVDPIAQGASQIRVLKQSSRERAEVEHCFGSGAGCNGTGVDNGMHKSGSAMALVDNDCSSVVPDAAREDGWLCVDDNGADANTLWAYYTAAWHEVCGGVPAGTIVIFDDASACPAGYTEYTQYAGILLRGRDGAAGDPDIPDNANVTCPGTYGATGCGPGAVAGKYDDTITTTQMPAHTHDVDFSNNPLNNPIAQGGFAPILGAVTSSSTGGDQPHYHPFRTALFCRKS